MNHILSKMTDAKRSNFAAGLVLIMCLAISISTGCKNDDEPPIPVGDISEEIKSLIYFKGDERASKVLINAQGGPDTSISTDEVDLIDNYFDTDDLLLVNVHQAQTLDSNIVTSNDITLEQAVNFNAASINTLAQVIDYFKQQGRTVYVLGASFGAFVTQELIAQKGIDVADKYLIMIGRLDINDVMWQGLVEGKYGYFDNGITPIVNPTPAEGLTDRNLGRIAAGLGMNNYTQRLSSIEDLSDLTYVYGATDQFVGSLTTEEVRFLESRNANIIRGSGGHDDTFLDFIGQGLFEAFGIR
ncbi:MAG: hypothetical protein AB8F95_12255 [Bacteroidia bacterium]